MQTPAGGGLKTLWRAPSQHIVDGRRTCLIRPLRHERRLPVEISASCGQEGEPFTPPSSPRKMTRVGGKIKVVVGGGDVPSLRTRLGKDVWRDRYISFSHSVTPPLVLSPYPSPPCRILSWDEGCWAIPVFTAIIFGCI